MKNLRAGLVGLGMMGRHHARVLASLPGVDFIGVSDPAGDVNGVAQGRPVVKSVAELIALGIDYAVVAVPTIYHLEIGLELAAAGIHAMVEKPLSQDTATAKDLAKTFAHAGLVGAVGHIERYNPALQEARRRLEQLGSLYRCYAGLHKSAGSHLNQHGFVYPAKRISYKVATLQLVQLLDRAI